MFSLSKRKRRKRSTNSSKRQKKNVKELEKELDDIGHGDEDPEDAFLGSEDCLPFMKKILEAIEEASAKPTAEIVEETCSDKGRNVLWKGTVAMRDDLDARLRELEGAPPAVKLDICILVFEKKLLQEGKKKLDNSIQSSQDCREEVRFEISNLEVDSLDRMLLDFNAERPANPRLLWGWARKTWRHVRTIFKKAVVVVAMAIKRVVKVAKVAVAQAAKEIVKIGNEAGDGVFGIVKDSAREVADAANKAKDLSVAAAKKACTESRNAAEIKGNKIINKVIDCDINEAIDCNKIIEAAHFDAKHRKRKALAAAEDLCKMVLDTVDDKFEAAVKDAEGKVDVAEGKFDTVDDKSEAAVKDAEGKVDVAEGKFDTVDDKSEAADQDAEGKVDVAEGKVDASPKSSLMPVLKRDEACTADDPCDACEGNCDEDEDCKGELMCKNRDHYFALKPVPGCLGSGEKGSDYCFMPGRKTKTGSGEEDPADGLSEEDLEAIELSLLPPAAPAF